MVEKKAKEVKALYNLNIFTKNNRTDFHKPLETPAYRLSKDTEMPQTRISQILKGNGRIAADSAMRLSSYFGNSPKFWLGLQDDYDIEEEKTPTMIFSKE